MTGKEKRQLVYLLNKYQNELLLEFDLHKYNHGKKAQYNHARILVNKLSVEKENEIIPYFNYEVMKERSE